jgi:hypothetical protein
MTAPVIEFLRIDGAAGHQVCTTQWASLPLMIEHLEWLY